MKKGKTEINLKFESFQVIHTSVGDERDRFDQVKGKNENQKRERNCSSTKMNRILREEPVTIEFNMRNFKILYENYSK